MREEVAFLAVVIPCWVLAIWLLFRYQDSMPGGSRPGRGEELPTTWGTLDAQIEEHLETLRKSARATPAAPPRIAPPHLCEPGRNPPRAETPPNQTS